jgi:hypothetical protein
MMLALDQAGALQNSQSPVGADMRDGDGTSMLFWFASRWSILLTSEKLNEGESHTHLTTHSGRRAHRRTS